MRDMVGRERTALGEDGKVHGSDDVGDDNLYDMRQNESRCEFR